MLKRKYYYLLSLLFVFVVPTLVAAYFVMDRISLSRLGIFVISITLLGSLWDVWATRHGKKDAVWLWTFNTHDTIGVRFLDLPIEEYLFYVASSVYVVFLWEIIKYTLEEENILFLFVFPFLAVWSMFFIVLPYFLREKKDRLYR